MTKEERLNKEYKEWFANEVKVDIDEKKLIDDLKKELKMLSSMSVQEYTLYRKFLEIKTKYPETKNKASSFFIKDTSIENPQLTEIKNNIWIPKNPDDYLNLEPEILWTMKMPKNGGTIWSDLRVFTSTMLNNPNICRNLRFIVIDKKTGKYLGVLCVSSDFMDLTPRDSHIGWSREIKTTQKMINHTAIGSTIVPTQPLGYNFLGGKLLALLTISDKIENAWNERYSDKLAGITTTSLYGSFSQYNGLKYWKKMGHSAGSIKFEPSKETVLRVREWLRQNHPRKYWEWYLAKNDENMPLKRDHKQRSLAFAYKEMKIHKSYFETNHQRGIYWCNLFENTNEFLRKEIDESKLIRRFDNSVDSLVDIWKEKYVKKRIEKLVKEKKYNTKTLFYDKMIGKNWENVKKIYLGDVGR